MEEIMKTEPVFLTDKNRTVLLEALEGAADAALPDCCRPFEPLSPNTAETPAAAGEKHLPVVETNGQKVTVKVGSIFHPMTEEHSIVWVSLSTKNGRTYRAQMAPGQEPAVHFTLEEGDAPKAAYAFCNLHGFWKTTV